MSSAVATTSRILFEDLDDLYYDDEDGTFPDVYSHEYDGEEWLTDRYWILPRSALLLPHDLDVKPLAGEEAQSALRKWIDAAKTGELRPATGEFAATFAGVLTLHGLTAYDCGIEKSYGKYHPPHVLVRPDGSRVGLLMPTRDATTQTSPIPARPAMLALFERIDAAGVVGVSEAWLLAADLTATGRAS